jgi:hypothetical protein
MNATFSFFTTSLICNSVSGATGYQFQLDTLSSFNNPPFFIAQATFNGTSSPVLKIGKTYHWRARCYKPNDTSVWSASRSFTVVSGNLGLNSPVNNSSGNIVALRSMDAGSDTSIRYQFEVDTASNLLSNNKRSLISGLNQFVDSTFFKYSQVIFWRARAFNQYGDTFQWSPIWKYTTNAGPTWATSGSIFMVDPMYFVNWTNAGLSKIQIQLDTNLNFNTPNLQERFPLVGKIQDTFQNLMFGKDYYVRLRGFYGNSFGSWSSVQAIRIKSNIAGLSPNNGSTIYGLSPTFSWSQLRGANCQIQVFTNMAKSGLLLDTTTSSTNFIFNASLDLNTQYPWRIRAFHEKDTLPWVELNFKIFNGQVNLSQPFNNSTITTVRPQLNFYSFAWATGHVLEIDTGSVWPATPSAHYIRIDSFRRVGTIFIADTTLLYGQKYIWRVYAMKGQEQAEPSSRLFTTPSAPSLNYPPNNFIGT